MQTSNRRIVKGAPARTLLLTGLALTAFAGNSLLCRLALANTAIDPANYTAIRLTSGALLLWLVDMVRRRSFGPGLSGGGWLSAAMLFVYATAFSFAYVSLSAAIGALILFASVQFTMIVAGLCKGEHPSGIEWAGWFLAAGGLIYLISPGIDAPPSLGALLMAMAGAAWGLYSLRGQVGANPISATAGNFLRTVPMVVLLAAMQFSSAHLSFEGIVWAALSGTITSGLGYVIWYAALAGLSAMRAALVQLAVPIIAALSGVLLLNEQVSVRLLVAGAAVIGGIALAIAGDRKRN